MNGTVEEETLTRLSGLTLGSSCTVILIMTPELTSGLSEVGVIKIPICGLKSRIMLRVIGCRRVSGVD